MRSRRPAVRVPSTPPAGPTDRPKDSNHRVRLTESQTRRETPHHILTGLRRTFYAVLGMVLSRSAVLAGWQCRQGVELGLVQGDVGRGGVGGDLHFSFGADDRRGDRRAG